MPVSIAAAPVPVETGLTTRATAVSDFIPAGPVPVRELVSKPDSIGVRPVG